ncbi:MAG: MBL fold metallo-hydrolase [bacterium]
MQRYFFKDGYYFNHSNESRKTYFKKYFKSIGQSFLAIMRSRFVKDNRKFVFTPAIKDEWICNKKPIEKSFEPIITWVGQATFLIQIGNVNILTDPVFGNLGLGFNRNFPPGISLNDLPKIDYVLISHNHRDHLEINAVRYVTKKYDPVFLIPQGNKRWFNKLKIEKVMEFKWDNKKTFFLNDFNSDEISFHFLPAFHWSTRGLFDMNTSLWGSWMIEFNGYKIYFAGDSAYDNHFKRIGEKFKKIDVVLMPIGPNEPEEMVIHSHVSSEQAGQAFLDLNAHSFIPMHWGTFRIAFDHFDDPIKRLKKWWSENEQFLKGKNLNIVKFGQPIKFDFDLVKLKGVENECAKRSAC